MEIHIKPLIFEKLRPDLERLHVIVSDKNGDWEVKGSSRHRYNSYSKECDVDLSALTKSETQGLLAMLKQCGVHGAKILAADIEKFLRASDIGIDKIRARTCRQAAWMLELFIAQLPHHIVFSEDEYGGKSRSGYFVGDVDYEPEKPGDSRRERQEEYAELTVFHMEDGCCIKSDITLRAGDCRERTCVGILAGIGMVPETPELMAKLWRETKRFEEEKVKIGKQCIAVGLGLCDLDDSTEGKKSRFSWRADKIALDHFGSTRVVVDIEQERDDDGHRRRKTDSHVDPYRWHKQNLRFHAPSEDELVRHLEEDEDTAERPVIEIPVHPLVPCFDLRRHVRLRVHINNLADYVYDKNVAERLVLPERDWRMVNLLVDCSANTFEDIVGNKGRSMNILAEGPPGVGKSATAEVFAEFKERPLYTVQCSQLGLSAQEVEKNLSVILERANRWNAILLLDEADVYIRKRGTDLEQNAIVGTFLRILEYASCIMFMTTNLKDQVDDAITSRCIARLRYEPPGPEAQARIWKILAKLNSLHMPDDEIEKVAKAHPKLTGRDVKNLIKLASFVEKAEGRPLTAEAIEYVLQFKPTDTAG